jgi:hypothetical protein
LLLWSLWGGEFVCTGNQALFQCPTFYGENYASTKNCLRVSIDRIILDLNSERVNKLGLNPGLFLLLESYRHATDQFQTLLISPIIDLLSSKQKLDVLPEHQSNQLESVKAELQQVLSQYKPQDPSQDSLWRNILKPFHGSIDGLGRPSATDKIRAWMAESPALHKLKISQEVLESHARAFNQFRNSVVHYAGLPNKEIKLSFESGRSITISRKISRDQMLRALIYYNQLFRDFLMLHFLRSMSDSPFKKEQNLEHILKNFFMNGFYNDHDWLLKAFKDQIIGDVYSNS